MVKKYLPIKVLWVNDHLGFSDGVVHGAAQVFRNVMPRFDKSKVDPTLCILRGEHPFKDEMIRVGVSPIFFSRARWDPRVLFDLLRIIHKKDIKILHLHGQKAMIFGIPAALFSGCKIIVHVHDTNFPQSYISFVHRIFSRWTDLAIGVSNIVSDGIPNNYGVPPDRVISLANAIPTEEYFQQSDEARRTIRRELSINNFTTIITIVGRFMPQKGHIHMIKAMYIILQRLPDVTLLIAGDGPLRSEYEELIDKLEIKENVRILGQRKDIPDVLAATDIFAMPSLAGEGLPLACIESISAGVPVVAYNSPGIDEVIDNDETGMLVENGNIEELALTFCQLLKDANLLSRLSSNCIIKSKKWDVGQYVKKLEEIYQNIIEGKALYISGKN